MPGGQGSTRWCAPASLHTIIPDVRGRAQEILRWKPAIRSSASPNSQAQTRDRPVGQLQPAERQPQHALHRPRADHPGRRRRAVHGESRRHASRAWPANIKANLEDIIGWPDNKIDIAEPQLVAGKTILIPGGVARDALLGGADHLARQLRRQQDGQRRLRHQRRHGLSVRVTFMWPADNHSISATTTGLATWASTSPRLMARRFTPPTAAWSSTRPGSAAATA